MDKTKHLLGLDTSGFTPLPEGIEAQTRRVMEGLGTLLAGINASFDNIVSARVFLTHFKEDFAKMMKLSEGTVRDKVRTLYTGAETLIAQAHVMTNSQ